MSGKQCTLKVLIDKEDYDDLLKIREAYYDSLNSTKSSVLKEGSGDHHVDCSGDAGHKNRAVNESPDAVFVNVQSKDQRAPFTSSKEILLDHDIESPVKLPTDSNAENEPLRDDVILSTIKTRFKKKKNPDLWKRFLDVYKKHDISFKWIRGHSGHIQNEQCDQLAVEASTELNLEVDEYFEKTQNKSN